MRSFIVVLTFAISVCAQTAAPAQTPPPAPVPAVAPGRTQPATPAKPVTPDTVVATVDGHPYTAADIDKMLSDLPPQYQANMQRDPAKFLSTLFLMQHLERQAELHNLDKEPMWHQQLEFSRMQVLANAEVNKHKNDETINLDQEKQFYEANKENYRTVKVKVIYLSFNPNPAAIPTATSGKTRTEVEAKAKIDDLRKQAVLGSDFGKLAKENSEDKTSAAKDGDFGEMTITSPYPEAVKKAVFALKQGEISEPVRQPNGYYLFKAIETTQQTFEKVQPAVHNQLVNAEFNAWIQEIQKHYEVKLEDPSYFSNRTPH